MASKKAKKQNEGGEPNQEEKNDDIGLDDGDESDHNLDLD